MTRRSAKRTALGAMLCAAATAAVLLACTVTQSLDYLQKGDGLEDVVSEKTNGGGEGGEAGTREPTVLVPDQTKPGFLAQDATTLYWIGAGTVLSVVKTGGTPKTLGMVAPTASSLVADPDPNGGVFVAVGNDVMCFPKDGTNGVVVFKGNVADPPPDTLAANEASLYVLQYDQTLTIEGSRILRMAKDGGGSVDIAPDSGPSTLNLDTNSVFWLNSDPAKPAFVEQAKAAAPGTGTKVYSLGVDDDIPVLSSDVAIDDAFIYWTADDATSGNATIFSRKRDAAAATVAIFRGDPEATFAHLAIDATHAYVIDTKSSILYRVPKSGGDAEKLLVGLKAPSGLAVDATAIYLTVEATGSTGQVLSVKK